MFALETTLKVNGMFNIFSFSAPLQIRENGDWYKYLRLEQEVDCAHHELNLLEEQFRSVKNKAQNFFLMLKAFKNKQKIDKSVVKPIKKYYFHFILLSNLTWLVFGIRNFAAFVDYCNVADIR